MAAMADETLTPQRVLEAAEEVLRRFGPSKATVVDVARVLGVSHGSVYRHFSSKTALREAVVNRWLERVSAPLAEIAAAEGAAADRLRRWLAALSAAKRAKAADDPELFATYVTLIAAAPAVEKAHVDTLVQQIGQIVSDGVARGEFVSPNSAVTARAVLHATARFHHPVHAPEWQAPDLDAEFDAVWSLILTGLRAPAPE